MPEKHKIYTIGDIRQALQGRDDSEQVWAQVVAQDGTTWLMNCGIAPMYGRDRNIVIDLRHPELKTLPTEGNEFDLIERSRRHDND